MDNFQQNVLLLPWIVFATWECQVKIKEYIKSRMIFLGWAMISDPLSFGGGPMPRHTPTIRCGPSGNCRMIETEWLSGVWRQLLQAHDKLYRHQEQAGRVLWATHREDPPPRLRWDLHDQVSQSVRCLYYNTVDKPGASPGQRWSQAWVMWRASWSGPGARGWRRSTAHPVSQMSSNKYQFCNIRGNILHQCTEIRTLVIQNSFWADINEPCFLDKHWTISITSAKKVRRWMIMIMDLPNFLPFGKMFMSEEILNGILNPELILRQQVSPSVILRADWPSGNFILRVRHHPKRTTSTCLSSAARTCLTST